MWQHYILFLVLICVLEGVVKTENNLLNALYPQTKGIDPISQPENEAPSNDQNLFIRKKIELLLRKLQIIAEIANQYGAGRETTTEPNLFYDDTDVTDAPELTEKSAKISQPEPLSGFLRTITGFALRTITAISQNFQQQTNDQH